MTGLDIFALIILIVLIITFVGGWAMLGLYPGKIARERNHPQAEAISACGWIGAITMGILSPLAFVWAFTNPVYGLTGRAKQADGSTTSGADSTEDKPGGENA